MPYSNDLNTIREKQPLKKQYKTIKDLPLTLHILRQPRSTHTFYSDNLIGSHAFLLRVTFIFQIYHFLQTHKNQTIIIGPRRLIRSRTIKTNSIENLVTDYLARVKSATALLEDSFGVKNILGLWRSKKIPQRGPVTAGVTYELHGIGCCVYLSEICIDFDHGPDGRVDGFDAWRLYMYACELPHKYKKYTNKEFLEREFTEYLKEGKTKKIEGTTSNLYFIQP
ncbi:DUF6896 domain-containing protein [Pseudomonas capeferrum]